MRNGKQDKRLNDKSKVRVINGNHIKYIEDIIGIFI